MNVGQRTVSDNALVKFGILPAVGGGIVGTGIGVHDKMTNPHADYDTVTKSAAIGALGGLAIGGASASSFRGFRDFKLKQSTYTNAPKNHAQSLVLGNN